MASRAEAQWPLTVTVLSSISAKKEIASEIKTYLAEFIALQHFRSPRMYDFVEKSATQLMLGSQTEAGRRLVKQQLEANAGALFPDKHFDEVMADLEVTLQDKRARRHYLTDTLSRRIPDMAKMLLAYNWQLQINKSNTPYLTSDHPAYVRIDYSAEVPEVSQLEQYCWDLSGKEGLIIYP